MDSNGSLFASDVGDVGDVAHNQKEKLQDLIIQEI